MSLVRQSTYGVDGGGGEVFPQPGRVGEMWWMFFDAKVREVLDVSVSPIAKEP